MSQPITRFGPDATATTVPPLSLYGLNWDIIKRIWIRSVLDGWAEVRVEGL